MYRVKDLTTSTSRPEMTSSGTGPDPGTYLKMKTHATPEGIDFEVKTSALLYLKALDSGRRFKLASNALGVGAFDDILFLARTLGDSGYFWSTYLFQLKHKLRADITYEALNLSSKGDFALVKYYDSFLKTKQTMVKDNQGEMFDGKFEDCKFVIFTNASASKKLVDHEITKASANVDDIVKFGGEEIIFGLNGGEKIVSCLEGKSYAEDFLNKLMIFSNEPRVEKMDDLISEEILKKHKCTMHEAKGITEILVKEFQKWCAESIKIIDEDSDLLNRAINKHKIQVSYPTQLKRISPLALSFKESFVHDMERAISEKRSLLHIITKEHLIEVTCSKLLQALKNESFIPTSLENFLQEKDVFLTDWENLLVIAADATQSTPGDLAIMDDLGQVLIKEDTNKRVVFVSTVDNEFIARLKKRLGDKSQTVRDSFKLNQLTPETLENNLKIKMTFQGRVVEKSVLVGDTIDSFQALSSHISSFVVKNVITTIGKELPELLEFFIPRYFYRRNVINGSIFKQSSLNGKFAISGITEGRLRTLIPYDDMQLSTNKHVMEGRLFEKSTTKSPFLVLSTDDPEGHFNQLAKVHPNIHWLHMEAGQLTWKRSQESVGDILEYVDERYTVYNPNNVLDLADRIVLLVAEPGMGKTTLLTRMARQIKEENPSDWVVMIKLSDHSDQLELEGFNAREFLSTVTEKSPLDKALFEHNLANIGNVVFLIDGVDELSENCLENCKVLLKHMVETNVKKIWVTSRHSRGHMLEILLSTISWSLQLFTLGDQKDFFKSCWRDVKTTMDKTQQEDFITKIFTLVSSSIGEQERQFAGIPLHTKMLAVIFDPYYAKGDIANLPESLSMLDIYKKFVEMKYQIAFEKNGNRIRNNKKAFKGYCQNLDKEHMAAALVVLLDSPTLQSLHDKHLKRVCDKLVSDVLCGEETSGIVDQVVNGMPQFVHKIISEFYAGIWLAENYQKNTALLKTHFCSEEFRVIRNIFDRKLSKGNPLHTAVLNGDRSQVDHLLESGTDVNSVDLGGRTALHLAAAVGFRDLSESKVNLSIVTTLLDHGADIALYDTSVLKWTPLRYADETGAFDIIDLLLKNKKVQHDDLKLTKKIIVEHLHLKVIIKNGFLSLMGFLLGKGLNANATLDIKDSCCSLLHKSAEYGDENLSKLLIKHGAAIISRDKIKCTPLHKCADYGHLSIAQLLLENISDDQDVITQYVNERNIFSVTALYCAAQGGHVEIMRLLVSVGGDLKALGDNGSTLLHAAAMHGRLTVAQFLLENISDDQDVITQYVNARNTDSVTALYCAAQEGHVDIMRLLVSVGGDLKALGDNGFTLLHAAALNGHSTVAQFLLENISDDQDVITQYVNERNTDSVTALYCAAQGGHVDIMRLLVSVGGDLKALGDNGFTLLHAAALKGHSTVAQFLLENISDDQDVITQYVNARSTDSNTALHWAAKGGHVAIMRLLVSVGGDLKALGYNGCTLLHAIRQYENARNTDSRTALHLAAEGGHVEIIRLLISVGGDLEALGYRGSTLLHAAALKGHSTVAQFLLENISDDQDVITQYVNARNTDSDTALHWAAQGGHVDIMRLLVSVGGDLEALGYNGRTLLHAASLKGRLTVAQFLLENISDDQDVITQYVNARNTDSDTALHLAAAVGHVAMMRLLVSVGGDLKTLGYNGRTLLHAAAMHGRLTVARFLLENISDDQDVITQYVNARKPDSATALYCAAAVGHVAMMRLLVSVGGDLKTLGYNGRTLLHAAAMHGRLTVAQFLLENISDDQDVITQYVNASNTDSDTALHWAAQEGHVDIMHLLVSVGSDLEALGYNGRTLLHAAALKGHSTVAQFLLENISDDQDVITQYVNERNTNSVTALHLAARGGHVDMMRLLVSVGGDLKTLGYNGLTLLHVAALKGRLTVAQFLLENISDDQDVITQYVNARSTDSNTALHFAAYEGHVDIMHLLVSVGGDLTTCTDHNSTTLNIAAQYGHFLVVDFILDTLRSVAVPFIDYLNICDNDGDSAVHNAACNGHSVIVRTLADNGADATLPNNQGQTALHVAALYGHLSTVEVLVERLVGSTAFLDAQDHKGETALSTALRRGHTDIASLLAARRDLG